MVDIIVTICVVVIVLVIPVTLIVYALMNYRKLEEKRKAKLAKIRAQQEETKMGQLARELERNKKTTIVEVKYLGAGAVSQKRGGIGGAMLGGFFAGPIGAVVGAALPKNAEGKHRFAVRYANGRVEIKELHPNSWEYKKLIKMVKWEEL